ncbi:MAG: S9 family peptidase [Roseiflexaceae bacterium]|nr:S9 family peptidase [Roseiflexaceae bacterium]
MNPPTAHILPSILTHAGRSLADNYAWLQDKSDPEVLAYLAAENEHTAVALAHTAALQETIFQELRGRIKEDDNSAPQRRGDYAYYTRIAAGQQYRTFCRRALAPDAPEQVLLDENALAEGHSYCRVRIFDLSPDQHLLAYGVDTTGAWVYDLYALDMASGATVAGPIANVGYTAAWAGDSRTLFYTIFDEAHRPFKLLRHRIGASQAEHTLVYHETDDALNAEIGRSTSGALLVLTVASHTTSEVRILPAAQPEGQFQLIAPRQPWIEYYVTHHGDQLLIRTNEQAENFKLMAAPLAAPARANWRELIAHRADTLLSDVTPFQDYILLHERSGGLIQLRVAAPDLGSARTVAFPEPTYDVTASDEWGHDFASSTVRLAYSSLVTPNSSIDYDMADGVWRVVKQLEIPSGYNAALYVSERLEATAADGSRVPISLVYRRDRTPGGPLVLYGYGSYGFSIEPEFDAKRISLLDRGFAYAIAHIRGGSELGRAWYEQGRLLHKKNSFSDFITCAEHLVAQGYTAPERLAIMGASAGGLLVTAVANMRPDLCRAVVALVPFTNVVTAMLMPELPLTVPEYEQWGNPADDTAYTYMLSYSPYDNIQPVDYPHMLVRAGLSDLQVPFWDPAKYVAKLRTHSTGERLLLLLMNMGAGHGGASGRYDHLHEDALNYAFLIDVLEESPQR